MSEDDSLLAKLDAAVPAPLAQLDAFPKLPSTYKARSEGRGFLTIFVAFCTFLLMLNDIGEYVWGWPDYEFSIDHDKGSFMNINVDMTVNMPCGFLSVDLRDAVGDRLYLTGTLSRDGTVFDTTQATALKEHAAALTASQAVKQSRSSRGLFSNVLPGSKPQFRPLYKHTPSDEACRIWGTMEVKKVTANFHITTLGHGYVSHEHVPHEKMNLSHVISEFSFGPFFPDITQPLDASFEVAQEPFMAYQYFLHIVPTTYIAPRSAPLSTNQYSVTHYTRTLEHGYGTPGIFFKFELDPLAITINQRTTTFIQLMIRCVGVIGGAFVCMGYAIRVTARAVEAVTGGDQSQGIVAAEASGVKVGLKGKWGGSNLRARGQGTGWTTDSLSNPGSPYLGSPYLSGTPPPPVSPYLGSPGTFGPPSAPAFGPSRTPSANSHGPPPRTPNLRPVSGSYSPSPSQYAAPLPPSTPSYGVFPPTPNPANGNGNGFPSSPSLPKKTD